MKFKLLIITFFILLLLNLNTSSLEITWNFETVDSLGHVGEYSSITIDNNNYPHISYYDYTNDDLKYAYWTGSKWNIQNPDINVGDTLLTDIAVDKNNRPHISYHDSNYADLKYAYWTGDDWDLQTIDSDGNVGYHSSIEVDSNNNPHICYYDYTNLDLKYAFKSGNNWVIQTLDSNGNVGTYSSLILDAFDYPHISYYDFTNMELKYIHFDGNNWISETVDSTMDVGYRSSIALDTDNQPHISYYDYTLENLKYAFWTGVDWVIQIVDSDEDVGEFNSIVLDAFDNVHICYYDFINSNLKYAFLDGENWELQVIDSYGYVGSYSSMAIDENNKLHISYYDFTKTNLKYAFSDEIQKNIKIVKPNGNEVLIVGENYEITWNSNNIDDEVNLYLFKDDIFERIISENIQNNGFYLWNIPNDIYGSTFKIKIENSFDTNIFDFSDQFFSISSIVNDSSPDITVITPINQNELLYSHDTYNIRWTSENVEDCVNIYLYKQGFYDRVILNNTSNDGSYIWNMPDDLEQGISYNFKIESCLNSSVFDLSDNSFQFVINNISNEDFYIRIIQPNGGESWHVDTNYNIEWESNINNSFLKIILWNESISEIIIDNTSNDGFYTWDISDNQKQGNKYRIELTAFYQSNEINDFSNNYFSIYQKDNATIVEPNLYVTILPEKLNFVKGEKIHFMFLIHDSKGNPISNATIEIDLPPPLYSFNKFQGYSDKNGRFNLTANCYVKGIYKINVTASKPGYQKILYQKDISIQLSFLEEYYLLIYGIIFLIGISCGILIGFLFIKKKYSMRKPPKISTKFEKNKDKQKKDQKTEIKEKTVEKEKDSKQKTKKDIYEDIDKLLESFDKDKKEK